MVVPETRNVSKSVCCNKGIQIIGSGVEVRNKSVDGGAASLERGETVVDGTCTQRSDGVE